MKNFIPFAHATSVYEVETGFFLDNGIKFLFMDLDNTLDSYKLHKPSKRAIDFCKRVNSEGIKVVIISNNKKSRVDEYASELNASYIYRLGKPFPKKINKFIKNNSLNKNEIMVVGDQLMTDVLAGNRAHLKVLLTEKIVKEDQLPTHINRIFDKPIRKYLNKKGLLIDWRKKYNGGQNNA